MLREILIDADVVAYEAASACEVAIDMGDGYWTWHVNFEEVTAKFWGKVEDLMERLNGDSYKLCLTDSLGNFRKSILPTYKGNRSNVKKPIVLQHLKAVLINDHDAYFRPGLEGDDCIGILATVPSKNERVIWSIDKDFKTIPGLFARGTDDIIEVSETEADYWHMFQTLTGDATDGYSGCPGIGPKKAEAILDQAGEELWQAVVKTYDRAGLSEPQALIQARVARILRASDYDFKKKEPILWVPN